MINTKANIDNIDWLISDLETKIKKAKEVRELITELSMFEVGIRKIDNQAVYVSYTIRNHPYPELDIEITVLPPNSMTPYRVTIQEFKEGYIPYSPKARSVLPRRD